jgi:hypothetical protein
MKASNKRGFELPWVYESYLLATRLGYRTWDDVLETPHLELMLRLDLLRIDHEVAEWNRRFRS